MTAPAGPSHPVNPPRVRLLAAYLQEERDIGIKRSRIDELLIREGLRWKMQETWFSERVDPDFAEKRGPSSRSTRRHLRAVS